MFMFALAVAFALVFAVVIVVGIVVDAPFCGVACASALQRLQHARTHEGVCHNARVRVQSCMRMHGAHARMRALRA